MRLCRGSLARLPVVRPSGLRPLRSSRLSAGSQPETAPETFGARPGAAGPRPQELANNVGAAWELLLEKWDSVRGRVREMDVSSVRSRWTQSFFDVLDYDLVYQRRDLVMADGSDELLESIFESRSFADFRALYRLLHASRFVPAGEGGAPLERFYSASQAAGVAVGAKLEGNVRRAIEALGNGFLSTARPEDVPRDEAALRDFYNEILTVVYRILSYNGMLLRFTHSSHRTTDRVQEQAHTVSQFGGGRPSGDCRSEDEVRISDDGA
jgi:hypothetical protein